MSVDLKCLIEGRGQVNMPAFQAMLSGPDHTAVSHRTDTVHVQGPGHEPIKLD